MEQLFSTVSKHNGFWGRDVFPSIVTFMKEKIANSFGFLHRFDCLISGIKS